MVVRRYGWPLQLGLGVATSSGGTSMGVLDWNGRKGHVVPLEGDYTDAQINNTSDVAGDTVADALNALLAAGTPELDGDVVGPIASNQVVALRGFSLDFEAQAAGRVLTFDSGGIVALPVANAFAGRTGAVVPELDDYAASLVANDSDVEGATVQEALNALLAEATAELAGDVTGPVSENEVQALRGRALNFEAETDGAALIFSAGNLVASSVVNAFAGRTGDVVAEPGDYAAAQISNDSTVGGATVAAALETLNTSKAAALVNVVESASTSIILDQNTHPSGTHLRCTSNTAVQITVQNTSGKPMSVGHAVTVLQAGTGQVSFVFAVGVTPTPNATLRTRVQGSPVTLLFVGSNRWDVMGDLAL
jgi:hypothetical protein